MKGFIKILKTRGLVDFHSKGLENLEGKIGVYLGIDPTSDSLHLGHLLGLIILKRFLNYGHKVVLLIGGATGMIGDPSGKSKERNLLLEKEINTNVERLLIFLKDFFIHDKGIEIVNNSTWYDQFSFLNFFRDVGKHFRLGPMLAKESVKKRLNSPEGLSYTEFSYQLFQAYDFFHLFKDKNIILQIGGSDQWGNITAGIDFIKKFVNGRSFALTFPLLTSRSGKKFGKSENNVIWLSKEKTSSYDLYQYLYKVLDQEVVQLLKFLTFIPIEEIEEMEKNLVNSNYPDNFLQKLLAKEVVCLLHGKEGLEEAEKATELISPGKNYSFSLNPEKLNSSFLEGCRIDILSSNFFSRKLIEVVVQIGLCKTKGEVRRLISQSGLYLNNVPVLDEHKVFERADVLEGQFVLLSIGKKKKVLLRLKSD